MARGKISRLQSLAGKVAVVTGASRGVGRGVAMGLCEAGATVHITGRTTVDGESKGEVGLGGSIHKTAAEASALGGQCIPHECDHRDDLAVEKIFADILSRDGRIDVLVNNVWAGYERMLDAGEFTWPWPFWKQPRWRWDAMFTTSLRGRYVSSQLAAPAMIAQKSGLIVNISFWSAQKYLGNVGYGVVNAAFDRMTVDMAHELSSHGVSVVSLYPGLVRTEGVMRAAQWFDLSNSESPQFIGRAVAGLANDPNLASKSGKVCVAAALALEYGFTDVDGKQPRPLSLETV